MLSWWLARKNPLRKKSVDQRSKIDKFGQIGTHMYALCLQTRNDIIRVGMVQAHFNQRQRPGEQRTERREFAFMKVIHQDTVKPDFPGRVSKKMKEGQL